MILVNVTFGAYTIQEKDALSAAENWLIIIDKGKYAESCKEAAEYFNTAVPEGKVSGDETRKIKP